MITIFIAIVIFLDLIRYLVIFDVILSWLMLAGIRFRPNFVSAILDPLYRFIRKYIPTRIGAFELAPIIVILGTFVIQGFILGNFPEVQNTINSLTR